MRLGQKGTEKKVTGGVFVLRTYGQRRLDEMRNGDTSSPSLSRAKSPSPLRLAKRARALDGVDRTEKPIPWKMAPTIIPLPSRPPKPNPFHSVSKEIIPAVANVSLDLPRRNLFPSDWNLDHLKEKRKKPESSLPLKIDSRGKPLVPVALGSRRRMTSKS